MKKVLIMIALVLLAGCGGGGGGGGGGGVPATQVAVVPPTPVLDTTFKTSCVHNDASAPIVLPSFNLSTNDWGIYNKTLPYSPKNCVTGRNITADTATATFEWNFPQIGESGLIENIKSYPEIIYGHQLNGASSKSSVLPLAVSEIAPTLAVNYDIAVTQTGWSQTLFDVVFTSGKGNNTLTTDIAVLVTKSAYAVLLQDPKFLETTTIDGVEYDVFANLNQPPRFSIFFLPRSEKLAGTFKIKSFSDYLLTKKFLNPNDYLDGIEFGTEVISGNGKTEVKSYSVTK